MKNIIFYAITACFLALSCNQAEKPAPVPVISEESKPKPAPVAETAKAKFPVHCFEQRMPDGSVLSFQYTEYYEDIVGILDYTFAEKDGAHGTFKGKKEGDIIRATWSYIVEGSNQSEDIMFRVQGDKAAKASGELVEGKGGKLMLKDPKSATWEEEFLRVECD